jgi:hypothetical protein
MLSIATLLLAVGFAVLLRSTRDLRGVATTQSELAQVVPRLGPFETFPAFGQMQYCLQQSLSSWKFSILGTVNVDGAVSWVVERDARFSVIIQDTDSIAPCRLKLTSSAYFSRKGDKVLYTFLSNDNTSCTLTVNSQNGTFLAEIAPIYH